MDLRWVSTPSGTWVCVVGTVHGIVWPLDTMWAARIEDRRSMAPGERMFSTCAEAKAWVEQTLTQLRALTTEQS